MEAKPHVAKGKYALLGQNLEEHPSKDILELISDIELELLNINSEQELKLVLSNTSYKGYLVLSPLRERCIKYIDAISDAAYQISSVNTIKRGSDGKLYGYNTDIKAFKYLVPRVVKGWKAVILGTGGGALAAAEALADFEAGEIILVSRNPEAARARIQNKFKVVSYNELRDYKDAKILINATPIGMHPESHISPLDKWLINARAFRNLELAIDLIYNPSRTKFLLDIERTSGSDNTGIVLRMQQNLRERLLGKRHTDFHNTIRDNIHGKRRVFTTSGLDMVIRHTLFAKAIWLDEPGITWDSEQVYDIKRKIMENQMNVVLIGMPGSGKSSIARMIARVLGRPFIDVDREVEKLMGEKIADVLVDEEKGEAYLRQYETEALKQVCCRTGCVIATGGGAILRPINRDLIRENGCVIYIRRPLDALSLKNRPLSQREGVEKLYKERVGIYRKICDVTVVNSHTFGESYSKNGEKNSYTYDLKRFAYKVIKHARYRLDDEIDERRTQFELAERQRSME